MCDHIGWWPRATPMFEISEWRCGCNDEASGSFENLFATQKKSWETSDDPKVTRIFEVFTGALSTTLSWITWSGTWNDDFLPMLLKFWHYANCFLCFQKTSRPVWSWLMRGRTTRNLGVPSTALVVVHQMDKMDPEYYPAINAVLTIFATLSVTTFTAERSFSALKLLKTYLRNNMGKERSGTGIYSYRCWWCYQPFWWRELPSKVFWKLLFLTSK